MFLTLLACCKTGPEFEPVIVKDRFSIELPTNLKRTEGLNEDATLEYSDPIKELYIIVLEEPKADSVSEPITLDRYFELASKGIEYGVEEGKLISPVRQTINELPAIISDISGKFEKENIIYKLAVIEGKRSFYQVLCWTLGKHINENEEKIDKMVASFTELN